ncbi:MAG: hypothetical protein IJU51_02235, partial [Clostridia bacterium]|nr:hypothetical protein [Clostridia bacterium]
GEPPVPIRAGEPPVPIRAGEPPVPIRAGEPPVPIRAGEPPVPIRGVRCAALRSEYKTKLCRSRTEIICGYSPCQLR